MAGDNKEVLEQRRGPGRPPGSSVAATSPARPVPRVRGDVNAVVRELGGRAVQLKLYRREGMEWAYLETVDGASLTLDSVRENYGPGKYQARWEKEDGSEAETDFSIARRGEEQQAVRTTQDALLLKIMERLERIERGGGSPRDDGMRELVTKLLVDRAQPVQPPRDPLLDTMIQALIARGNQQPSNGMDLMAVLKLVEEARNSGMSIAEKLAAMGGGDSTAAVMATIRDVGGPLASAIGERLRAENTGRRYVRPNAPAGETTVADVPKWVSDLRVYAPIIAGWAREDADAVAVATRVLDGLTDAQFSDLGLTLNGNNDEQLAQLLLAGLPQLSAYPGWLRRVVVEVRRMHLEATEPETPAKPKSAKKTTAKKTTAAVVANAEE